MIADLHCHYFPAEAASRADTAVSITPTQGSYRFSAGATSMVLDTGLLDLEGQIRDMRAQGVERRVLAVPPFTFQYELAPAEGVRWARAINDAIAAAAGTYPDQFVGFATVALQNVPSAVEELSRAVTEMGLRGVEIATNINGVELDAPALDPFWEQAQRLRTPILIHPHYVAGAERKREYHLLNLVGNPTETALAGARLLFGGVLERHPDLRIILSHGGGALPHIIGRLQHGYAARAEAKLRAQAPIEYLRRLYYDTIVFDAGVLRHIVETVGASQVVLGTDYPFDMSEPQPVEFVRRSGLAQADVEQILANGYRLLAEAEGAAARGTS
jgi:aminocarboxymuconate-semialdehyde decarboxylase